MNGTSRLLTLVFTDVEGSTELRARIGDSAATAALQRHEDRVRQQVATADGRVVKSLGDGFLIAFTSPGAAISCAIAMQDEQAHRNAQDGAVPLRVRMGMTTGEVVDDGSDLHGQAVHAAARIVGKAKAGEILVGEVVTQLAGPIAGVAYTDRGRMGLKGLPGRWHLLAVDWSPAAPAPVPPARVRRPRPAQRLALVGRRQELARIDASLGRAIAGEFRCVLVSGDAGVGKSRLAAAVLAEVSTVGLTARAFPLGATDSFGIWLEALDGHLRGMPAEEVRRYCGAFIDDLASVLPSVLVARGSAAAGEPPRSRLLQGLAGLLGRLAEDQALVVVLDDVHLADATSWEALGWFARNLAGHPILIVATARPVELRHHHTATTVLHGLEQDGALESISLDGLADPEVAELAAQALGGAAPPASLVAWLAQRSRGNPLFTIGLVRALVEEGADLGAPALRKVPEGLAERVAGRLVDLDEPTLATLETLAVLGSRIEVGDLVTLAGRPLDRLAPILDDLCELRLASVEDRGRSLVYEIAHPLIQEAIYERIGAARRRALHRRVARELVALGRLGMAAPHFARSAEAGDAEAVSALGDAIRQAEERELYREALAILGVLREILPEGDPRWLAVLDAMSWKADWVVDHRADQAALAGVEALWEILRLLEGTGDRVRLAGVQLRLASFLAWGAGEVVPARQLVTSALHQLESAGQHDRALVARNELAWLAGMNGDAAALRAAAADVVVAAEEAGDRFVTMQALGILATAECLGGAFTAGEAHLARSIAIAEEDDKRYRRNWNLGFLAMAVGCQGRLDEADAIMQEVRRDPQHVESIAAETFLRIELFRGRFDAVLATAAELVARYPDGLSRRRSWALAIAAIAAVELDRGDEARSLVAIAAGVYGGSRWFNEKDCCDWAEGVVAWHKGRLEDGLRILEALAVVVVDASLFENAVVILVDALELGAELGDRAASDRCRGLLDRAVSECEGPLYTGFADLGRAAHALAAGDCDDGARLAESAAAAFAAIGSPIYEGRALVVAGEGARPTDRDRASSLFERAAVAFDTCGAVWRRDRAVARLARLGARGRRAAAATRGPGSLSARERDVARLAAEGQTAKEIAAALFIGERTVETHLANAYAKLGVRSKQELRRRAADLDL